MRKSHMTQYIVHLELRRLKSEKRSAESFKIHPERTGNEPFAQETIHHLSQTTLRASLGFLTNTLCLPHSSVHARSFSRLLQCRACGCDVSVVSSALPLKCLSPSQSRMAFPDTSMQLHVHHPGQVAALMF